MQANSEIPRRQTWIAISTIAGAIILGGGGTPNPSTEIILQWFAAVAALAWIWTGSGAWYPTDRRLWWAGALILALPLAQLVPLPPSVWHAFPGRQVEIDALRVLGEEGSWRPVSTSPSRTLASILSIVPALLLMGMVGALGSRDRVHLIAAIAIMAILSALLGVLQLAGGHAAPRMYAASHEMVVTGFQANRNAAADIMLIGLIALGAFWGMSDGRFGRARVQVRWVFASAASLLALACVLTSSRAGLLLLLPAAAAFAAAVLPPTATSWRRLLGIVAAGTFGLIASGLLLLQSNTVIQTVASRFGFEDENRLQLWKDTSYAIAQYWPFGSGIGTFVPTFIAHEPLESVDASIPNRAHNDYLEFLLEGGIFGVTVLLAVAAIVVLLVVRAWRSRPEDRSQVVLAIGILAIIAAHSLVDYPMRSMSLACLAGLAVGLLSTPRSLKNSASF